MTRHEFFPYRTSPDGIALNLEVVGPALPGMSDTTVRAYEADSDGPVSLTLSAVVPSATLDRVIHSSELSSPPVRFAVITSGVQSRRRELLIVEGESVYSHVLEFRPQEWSGTVEVRACLIRTLANPSLPPGFGSNVGSLLAWSPTWRIIFDPPRSPPSDELEVVWRDFRTDAAWLQQQDSSMFALDSSGARPRLILNSAVQHATAILNSNATHGVRARIRDATYAAIVHQVWSSLLGAGLSSLAAQPLDPDQELPDPEELQEWERACLTRWAPTFFLR